MRKKMPSIPNMPKPTGKSGTSSTVKNVSNTGQMSTSTQKTGATGAVTNTTNISSVAGPSGSPSVSPSVTWNGGTNFNINPTLPTSASDSVRGAFAQAEGELASARQRALGMVPSEYRERVNQHFDRASTQISEHRKKLGY